MRARALIYLRVAIFRGEREREREREGCFARGELRRRLDFPARYRVPKRDLGL